MNKRNKHSENNIKNKLNGYLSNFRFKSINLNLSKQVVILGSTIGFISLFLPWIKNTKTGNIWNSFYSLTGNIGFISILILLITIFIILSSNYKEKIKLYSGLSLKNHFIVITAGLFILSFSIISLSFINGLHTTFFENIIYGKGIILCMTSGIIILIGGFMIRKEYYDDSSEIILNKLNENREIVKKKDNMKLPF